LPAGCYISLGYIEETCTIDFRGDTHGSVSESYIVRSVSFPPPEVAAAPAAAATGESGED